jgi:hypothetical protein
MPTSNLCYLEPVDVSPSVRVANGVAASGAAVHYAHIINLGNGPVRTPQGAIIGSPRPVSNDHVPKAQANHTSTSRRSHFEQEALTAAISEMNINPDLEPEQIEQLKNLIRSQEAAFAYEFRTLGYTDLATISIDTGDAQPISQAPYHASPAGRRIVEDTIAELLAEDVIEESESPWASPAILIRQKGKVRFCIDCRKINEVTKSDRYLILRIDDILSQFAGKMYFTTLNANKGFHQIEIDPQDREKTAFRTQPFGLKSGPAVFQRLMDKILGKYKWQIALVYIETLSSTARTLTVTFRT